MSKAVMIWLDGFSSRYLDPQKMPFIFELSRSGLSTTLEPLFAFAGIGASAFTGTTINTNKIWCDYVYKRGGSSPATLRWLLRLCDCFPDDTMNQRARYIICRIFGMNPGTPNLIPVELADFFRVKERKRLTDEEPIEGMTTLFDQLRRCGMRFLTLGFYESILEERLVKKVIEALAKNYEFILFRLGSPDKLGHKYGPESPEVTKRLGEIDKVVKEITKRGIESNPSMHFVIFSDHGMVPVREHVDLMSLLKGLPLRMPEDYILFLNSTVASFWFNNDKAEEIVRQALGKIEPGMILDEPKLKELEIDKIGSEYGDLIFALKEGSVFFPDFYRRRRPPKGMHGYAFAAYDKPPFIVYSPGVTYKASRKGNARFIDVMPTILDLLNLPIPPTCEGRSLLGGTGLTRKGGV